MSWLHLGQERNLTVASPQSSHLLESFRFPHEGHIMLTMSTFMLPCFAAARRSRALPPAAPTGNKTCTGGFMCLSIAFSGRPTLIPTVLVVCLPTLIPERWWTSSKVLSGSQPERSARSVLPLKPIKATIVVAHSPVTVAESLLRV